MLRLVSEQVGLLNNCRDRVRLHKTAVHGVGGL